MVKLIKPLFSDAASGVFHRVLAYRNGANTQSVGKLPHKINTVSTAQADHRATYKDLCDDWNDLNTTWKARWSAGAPAHLNGFSWFMKCQLQGIENPLGYRYKFELTLDNTNVDSDLNHFPVCIHLSGDCGQNSFDATDIFDKLGENKLKFAVTLDDHVTQVYVEIDFWDATGEKAVLWASSQAFTLLTATNTEMLLFYDPDVADNSNFVGIVGNTYELWHPDVIARYSCGQDPSGGAPQIQNSAQNAYHLTSVGTMLTADLIATPLGNGLDFDGVDDAVWVAIAEVTAWPLTFQITCARQVETTWRPIMALAKASVNNKQIFIGSSQSALYHGCIYNVDANWIGSSIPYAAGDFKNIVMTIASNTDQRYYTQGALESAVDLGAAFPSGLDVFSLGTAKGLTPRWNHGDVDHAVLWASVLTADWIKADHYSIVDDLIEWDD